MKEKRSCKIATFVGCLHLPLSVYYPTWQSHWFFLMYSGTNKGILQYYYSNFKSIHSVNAVVLQKSIIDITLKKPDNANPALCFHHYAESKIKLQWGKCTLENQRCCEGKGSTKGDVSAARFSWGFGALLTPPPALPSPPAPKGLSGRNNTSLYGFSSRTAPAEDHHESIQEPCQDLRRIKRHCLRLMVGSSFEANNKPEADKYKAHPTMRGRCLLF